MTAVVETEQIESIPQSLRSRDQWVLWRYEHRGAAKPTKVPYQPNGEKASTTNPATWSSFGVITAAATTAEGIGFVFSQDDPFCGVDLDNCFDEHGTLLAWAVPIVASAQECECYIERTPSGRGLHIIGSAALPHKGRKVSGICGDGAIEIYDRGRYFTVTGEQTDIGDAVNEIGSLLGLIWHSYQLDEKDERPPVLPGVPVLDAAADAMTTAMLTHSRGEFMGLWNGKYDVNKWGGDRSRARMSLLVQIALKLTRDGKVPTPNEVRAVALRSPFIREEMSKERNLKWPRLADRECTEAVTLAQKDAALPVPILLAGMTNKPKWLQPGYTPPEHVAASTPASFNDSIEPLDLDYVHLNEAPLRKWLLHEWIPRGAVTTLYGQGGVGKSLIAMQIGFAVASGARTLGIETTRGRVLGLFCEDDIDEVHHRTRRVATGFGMSAASLKGSLDFDARAGKNNILVEAEEGAAEVSIGPLFNRIVDRLDAHQYDLLILDNVAQLIAINENRRSQVTQAVNLLTSIALRYNLAVLLLGHPAKAEGSQFSGSTAWDAAVRSRIFMERDKSDADVIALRKAKANYSSLEDMTLRYENGYYVRTDGANMDIVERLKRERDDRLASDSIASAVTSLFEQELYPTSSNTSRDRYLPKLMQEHRLIPDGITYKQIESMLTRMLKDKRLKIVEVKGDNRHMKKSLVVT